MGFVVRAATRDDVQPLYELARQFTLINLPANKSVIEDKVERSRASFRGELTKDDAEYMFVVRDQTLGTTVASSLILAKNGTASQPNFGFRILKQEHFSHEIGIGFIHQRLRLFANVDGPTEVGGLVVDRAYRRRPEKVGRMISTARFVYIGMRPERFEADLHAEMAPPLTEDGRSDFWEALGRRFTGMPYQEADRISGQNNGFIPNLFPSEDIYLALLDTKARLAMGRVSPETKGALHLLNRVGFRFKDEVDPFDGGPYLGCKAAECSLIRDLKRAKFTRGPVTGEALGMIGLERDADFLGAVGAYAVVGDELRVTDETWRLLDLAEGEDGFVTNLEEGLDPA